VVVDVPYLGTGWSPDLDVADEVLARATDGAEREFQALLRANPQSTLVRKLLRIVREKRRSS